MKACEECFQHVNDITAFFAKCRISDQMFYELSDQDFSSNPYEVNEIRVKYGLEIIPFEESNEDIKADNVRISQSQFLVV